MLPVTGLGTVVFGAWMMNQKRIREELNLNEFWFNIWTVLSRFIVPVAVILILIYGFI